MDDANQYKELLDKIAALSADLEKSQQELNDLKKEIIQLSPDLPAAYKRSFQTRESKKNRTADSNFETIIGLRVIHFAGIIVMIIGLSIGVKYSIDENLISPFI